MDERPLWDRSDEERPEPTERVRIIGSDEAAEAVERGEVATRRGEGAPRFGDRPPAPDGDRPRPALRFPLAQGGADDGAPSRPRVSAPAPVAAAGDDDSVTARIRSVPGPAAPAPAEPEVLIMEGSPAGPDEARDDDLDAWSNLPAPGDGPAHRPDDAVDEPQGRPGSDTASTARGEEDTVSTLDETNARPTAGRGPVVAAGTSRHDDPVVVSDDDPAVSEDDGGTRGAPPAEPGRDVRLATLTGLGLAAGAAVLFLLGSAATTVLVGVVVVLCSAELFSALRRGGYQPATLLGLVASGGLVAATYWRGEAAVPVVLGLTVIVTLLWYLLGITRLEPTMNAGVTLLATLYVGLLGSFAALMLRHPDGRGLLAGTIIVVVANDVGALIAGRRFGRRPLAPLISPNKTVEGLVGATIASVLLSVLLLGLDAGPLGLAPWGVGSALALALVVSVMAPLGDLCESMVKRDLDLKDMSTIIPGHGGMFDRVDALLFCLPAVYYLARLMDLT